MSFKNSNQRKAVMSKIAFVKKERYHISPEPTATAETRGEAVRRAKAISEATGKPYEVHKRILVVKKKR